MIWDPSSHKPTGCLDTHYHHIVDVMVNETKNQVTQILINPDIIKSNALVIPRASQPFLLIIENPLNPK